MLKFYTTIECNVYCCEAHKKIFKGRVHDHDQGENVHGIELVEVVKVVEVEDGSRSSLARSSSFTFLKILSGVPRPLAKSAQ